MSRQAIAAIESGVYLPNVAIAVKLARAIGATVEEIFSDANEDHEQCVDACWKKSPSITTDRARVVLARIGGKIVAVADPTAHLTLPVSSGVRVKTFRGRADISTRLLDSRNRFNPGPRRMRSGGLDAHRVDGANGLSDKCRCASLFQWKGVGRTCR